MKFLNLNICDHFSVWLISMTVLIMTNIDIALSSNSDTRNWSIFPSRLNNDNVEKSFRVDNSNINVFNSEINEKELKIMNSDISLTSTVQPFNQAKLLLSTRPDAQDDPWQSVNQYNTNDLYSTTISPHPSVHSYNKQNINDNKPTASNSISYISSNNNHQHSVYYTNKPFNENSKPITQSYKTNVFQNNQYNKKTNAVAKQKIPVNQNAIQSAQSTSLISTQMLGRLATMGATVMSVVERIRYIWEYMWTMLTPDADMITGNQFEGRRGHRKKIKVRKQYKKFMLPLLIAYKLKFFTLIPVIISGLILLAGSTGMAGFFFALFAAVISLKPSSTKYY